MKRALSALVRSWSQAPNEATPESTTKTVLCLFQVQKNIVKAFQSNPALLLHEILQPLAINNSQPTIKWCAEGKVTLSKPIATQPTSTSKWHVAALLTFPAHVEWKHITELGEGMCVKRFFQTMVLQNTQEFNDELRNIANQAALTTAGTSTAALQESVQASTSKDNGTTIANLIKHYSEAVLKVEDTELEFVQAEKDWTERVQDFFGWFWHALLGVYILLRVAFTHFEASVYMLTLLRFNQKPNQADAKAFMIYLANTLSIVDMLGKDTVDAGILWVGGAHSRGQLYQAGMQKVEKDGGEGHWDLMLVVEYSKKQHFVRMLLSHWWRRGAAVWKSFMQDVMIVALEPATLTEEEKCGKLE